MVRNEINFNIIMNFGFPPNIAKFDSTVPGTFNTELDDITSAMISTISWTTAPRITLTTIRTSFEGVSATLNTTTLTSTTVIGSDNIFEVGSALFYIVIGAGSGILILSLIIPTIICFLVTTKGQFKTLAINDQSGDTESPNLHWSQVRGAETVYYTGIISMDPHNYHL
jgi:hypothetical protein